MADPDVPRTLPREGFTREQLHDIADAIAGESEAGRASLLRIIEDEPGSPRSEAALVGLHANRVLSDEVAKAAYPMLLSGDPFSVAAALEFFSDRSDAEYQDFARTLLASPSAFVRGASLRYLVALRVDDAVKLLSDQAADPDPIVRQEVADLIGENQLVGAQHLLEALATDPDEDVRQAAETAAQDLTRI